MGQIWANFGWYGETDFLAILYVMSRWVRGNFTQLKGSIMRTSLIGVVATAPIFATTAFAADQSCGAQAADKKLAGAAKTSLMRKCVKDSTAAAI
jgi:hypothetical protein